MYPSDIERLFLMGEQRGVRRRDDHASNRSADHFANRWYVYFNSTITRYTAAVVADQIL